MDRTGARRKLTQSTLFPHREPVVKEEENCNADREEDAQEDDDEEWRAGSKKRSGSKRNTNAKKKTPPSISKKVTRSSKGTAGKQLDDNDSSKFDKSSFFAKVSEKRKQNQPVFIQSSEDDDEICTPPSVASNGRRTRKRKRQDSSTPKKEKTSTPDKKMKKGSRELCFGLIPFDITGDEPSLQTIPDLRLEAKRTAEETSRIYSGKQVHPFFTSFKRGEKTSDSICSNSKGPSFGKKEKGIIFNPIHVFEDVEVDNTTLDWGQWIFSEKSVVNDPQCGFIPVNGESICLLNHDNLMSASHSTSGSLEGKMLDQPECLHQPPLSYIEEIVMHSDNKNSDTLLKDTAERLAKSIDLTLDNELENVDVFAESSCGENLGSELQDKLHMERITSHYHTCPSKPENFLWTDKYKPRNAKQICGNGESVTFLSEWLHLWHQKGVFTYRGCNNEDDMDDDYLQSCSESNSANDDDSLNNVLLVTGPVGSGKSAAIYSCARDQGFQVIEINASDWRSGALVKQKFGEAVESHWLLRNEVIELNLSDNEDSQDACARMEKSAAGENRVADIKSLILFEDVDVVLCEDHGFITAIQQLAETAKRPMILTCNSDNPVLPKNLGRSELSFSLPSLEELLQLLYKILAAENTKIDHYLVEKFVGCCEGDIRKTIMLLQYWCQGQTLGRGNESFTTCSSVRLDLDAAHHTIREVIPWGYPSLLSEVVQKEVLALIKQTQALQEMNFAEDINECKEETIYPQDGEVDPFEMKKEAMLKLNGSFQDEFECAQFNDYSELSDPSDSSIAFSRQQRRKKNTVLSSDSEDELSGDNISTLPASILETESVPSSHFLTTEIDEFEEDFSRPLEKDISHFDDMSQSLDMSFVQESSFVPETEILNEIGLFSATVSQGQFDGTNTSNQDQHTTPIIEPDASALSIKCLKTVDSDRSDATTPAYQEEVGDSLFKSEAGYPLLRGNRLLDECSRVDLMMLKSLRNRGVEKVIDHVQEIWTKVHSECKYIKNHVTSKEKTVRQVLAFAHRMSNLISEADLLLKDCQTIIYDYLTPTMIPSERMHSYTYYDNQLEMSSVLTQHGMSVYAKEVTSLGSLIGLPASDKPTSQEQAKINNSITEIPKNFNLLTRKLDSSLCDMLQSIVPSRSYLAAKGGAFYEYTSTLSQISRFYDSRISEYVGNRRQRRGRVPRHYLSSGSYSMSSEEILLLGQYNNYQKDPCHLEDEIFRNPGMSTLDGKNDRTKLDTELQKSTETHNDS